MLAPGMNRQFPMASSDKAVAKCRQAVTQRRDTAKNGNAADAIAYRLQGRWRGSRTLDKALQSTHVAMRA